MKSNIILLTLCLAAFASASLLSEFEAFKAKYGKVYQDETEEARRLQIYQNNVRFVHNHNRLNPNGHRVGINKFADLTAQEYQEKLTLTPRVHDNTRSGNIPHMIRLPTSVDWRKKGVVGPVIEPGIQECEVGYAVTTAVASAYAISGEKYTALSTEQVCNCSQALNAEKYIVETGVQFAGDWDGTCPADKITKGVCVGDYSFITAGSESDLAVQVAQQPVAVAIDASQSSFELYQNGIYYEPACSNATVDHDLLIVGYGVSKGQAYWIAQNSWGVDWGMEGYVWLAKDKDNNCGVATYASYPEDVKEC